MENVQLVVSITVIAVAEPEGGGSRGGRGHSRIMDCCICSPMASMYRLPRNAICAPCHEGAKAIIAFLNKDEEQEDGGHASVNSHGPSKLKTAQTSILVSCVSQSQYDGMRDAWERVKEMRDRAEETSQRAAFLEQGFALAWKEGIHTDIVAARSEVFRHLLSADEHCKAPAGDSFSFPELSHGELSLLLAFLYTGALDQDLPERHLHALLVAADKYDVAFLRRAWRQPGSPGTCCPRWRWPI
ncbi:BTB/POZ domain-containing protein [Panicum miliaceum]|uniref:BTB/POZ domain-containing protein n=1 Tax=Panicum miliaceum TaxID=4540 RepID=A0A3L6Q0Q5_PANMI|nr:BTB/POZ domain-containing protein [Panicum miliaceum]